MITKAKKKKKTHWTLMGGEFKRINKCWKKNV